jgi:hypothetical protein
MIPIITAFAQSPDLGQGLARDMPVRWALEEVGQPYEVRLVSFTVMKESTHRSLQPFYGRTLSGVNNQQHSYLYVAILFRWASMRC